MESKSSWRFLHGWLLIWWRVVARLVSLVTSTSRMAVRLKFAMWSPWFFKCSFMVIHALDGARGYPLDLGNLNITIRHYQPLRTIIHHYSQKYKHYYIYLYSVDGPTIFSPNTWGFLLFSRSRSTLLASHRIG